jgi:Spy/CpxP family protein refolding chaperone
MPKSVTPRSKVFYVYALLDPRKPGPFRYGHWKFSHEPFYIGKGINGRYLEHLARFQHRGMYAPRSAFKVYSQFRMYCKIRKIYRETGELPIAGIKRGKLTERQAFKLEKVLVARIGRDDCNEGPLINRHDGGIGGSSRQGCTKETRLLISKNSTRMHELKTIADKEKLRLKLSTSNRLYWQKMSDEEYERRRESSRNCVAVMSEKARKLRSKRISELRKRYWETLTPRQRAELNRKNSEAQKRIWAQRRASM